MRSSTARIRVALILPLFLCPPAPAAAQEREEIPSPAAPGPDLVKLLGFLAASEDARSPDLDYAVDFLLHVSDPNTAWRERTAEYTMIARGKDHSLVTIREPKQFHPGTLLIMDGLYWMLFPRANLPIQLSARNVLDGDVANGDLARGNLLKNYNVHQGAEETIRGEPCRVLDLVRHNKVGSYPRIRYAARKQGPRPVRLEYFGETGRLDRTVWYEDYRTTVLGTRSMKIVVESGRRLGEVTTMTFTDLRTIDVSGVAFDVDGLIAFRNAALRRFEADGRQARPEEIVALVKGAAR